MLSFPDTGALPSLEGFHCTQLTEQDADHMLGLQADMLAALPNPTWYYPSPRAAFAACCLRGEVFGFWQDTRLAGFGILTPWHARPDTCYAVKLQHPPQNTFDFQDVMVSPQFRRRGIHSTLLTFFERLARAGGGVAMYCTIAPDNTPSVSNFTKAGFVCIRQQPAYEGMLRGYYRKLL